ncbi:MAG: DUF4832 domain-containing protein [Mycobacterium sp.]|uniref:DUF4832 domain-containing protein n=1 Tax=Mycobacterium sp. TaxID=1785 RepID=UPI003C7915FF
MRSNIDLDECQRPRRTQLQISVAGKKRAGQLAIVSLALVLAAALTLMTVDYIGKTDAIPVTPLSAVQPGAVIPFAANDLVNPKRGQYQDLGVSLYPQSTAGTYPAWPGADDAGNRFLWSQIQPTSANSYDFTIIDKAVAAAHAHNQRFHFRVMSFASVGYSANTVVGVPAWLRAIPAATTDYHVGGKTYVVPHWNADAYLSPLEHLIAALGARYDHDERVEWFEFSGYGDWSENHIGFIAENLGAPGPSPDDSIAQLGYYSQYSDQSITKTSITRMVNATLAAFPDTQIIVLDDNPEITRQLLAASPKRPVGIRADCLGVYSPPQIWATDPNSWYVQNNDPVITALRARWRKAPVVTEWCTWQPDGAIAYFQQAIRDTVNYHVSLVASNVMAPSPDTYDMWARTNKYAGYRYAVTSATVPASAPAGSPLRITVRWNNFGTAPSYDNWQVSYEVRNDADKVVAIVQSGLSLRDIAAEQNYANSAQDPASVATDNAVWLSTAGLTTGNYKLIVKVVWNEHKPNAINAVDYAPMTLAQAGRDTGGGYPIGSFRLTG